MDRRISYILCCALSASYISAACSTVESNDDEPSEECAIGGTYHVGEPDIISGACNALPRERELSILPTSNPYRFEAHYAGAVSIGSTTDSCLLNTEEAPLRLDEQDATISMIIEVDGDALAATVDLETLSTTHCDVRYRLTGRRQEENGDGNPTGGSCETGADCTSTLCAFGGVSACAEQLCVYQSLDGDPLIYCSEPCAPGSCPSGYICRDFGEWVYRSDYQWLCALKDPSCGDSIIDATEVCDDGNTEPGDGCAAACDSDETCGNGRVDSPVGETCDDGNVVAGDGCNQFCREEACGNHVVDEAAGEQCDDGNQTPGDGCSDDCMLESCGNAIVDTGEGCDDGNANVQDGCTGQCRVSTLAGLASVEASWARHLPNAQRAGIVSHAATTIQLGALFAWTEYYPEGGPFGNEREVYVSHVDAASSSVAPPRRLPAHTGWIVEGLVTLSDAEVVMLLRDGASLALSRSGDAGGSFSDPMTITVPGLPLHDERDTFATLATDGRQLFLTLGLRLVVVENNRNLFFARMDADARTAEEAVRLSPDGGFRSWASRPEVQVTASGALVVLWEDEMDGHRALFAARSRDRGSSWLRRHEALGPLPSARKALTSASLTPGLGSIVAAWADNNGILLGRWDGAATQWEKRLVAGAATLGGSLGPVALEVDEGGSLYLAFSSAQQMLFTRAAPTLESSAPRTIAPAPPNTTVQRVDFLQMDLQGGIEGRLTLSWMALADDGDATGWTLLSAASDDGGETWSASATPQLTGESLLDTSPGGRTTVDGHRFSWVSAGQELWLVDASTLQYASPTTNPAGDAGNCAQPPLEGWCIPSTVAAPTPRYGASAVSTGDRVIVFGGHDGTAALSDGGIYDASTNSWSALDAGLPPRSAWGRFNHSAQWSGGEMLVFGGNNGFRPLGDGLAFSPASGAWNVLPAVNAPSARELHTAVSIDDQMIIFGGRDLGGALGDGAGYSTSERRWLPLPYRPELARYAHSAVAAGTQMIVYGGIGADGQPRADGFRYDTLVEAWLPLPTEGAPSARAYHHAVWTGEVMIVWGGTDTAGPLSDGAIYDLAADAWEALPISGAPAATEGAVAVSQSIPTTAGSSARGWLIWGGDAPNGARFDFVTRSWKSIPEEGSPAVRRNAAAAWLTGQVGGLLLFGGTMSDGTVMGDAGLYVPPAAR